MPSWVWGSGKNKLEANLESLAFNFVLRHVEMKTSRKCKISLCVSINPHKNYFNYKDGVILILILYSMHGKRFSYVEETHNIETIFFVNKLMWLERDIFMFLRVWELV